MILPEKPERPVPPAVHNEQVKLTAGYLNSAASGFLGAGVIAPVAALAFGVAGPGGPVPPLTLAAAVTIFLAISIAAHVAALRTLRRLRP